MPKRIFRWTLVGFTGLLLAGAAPPPDILQKEQEALPSEKQLLVLQALTPESVQRAVTVQDDDLETVATLTTDQVYHSNGRFTDRVRSDNFLRAVIDKATGSVIFQVYQEVSYNYEWRQFRAVNFTTPEGPRSAPVDEISHEITGCFGKVCSFKDDLGFVVDEKVLREIAALYVPGNSPFWRFRFHAQNGIDWNDRMMPAEVAGLLAAVDAYQKAHPRGAR